MRDARCELHTRSISIEAMRNRATPLCAAQMPCLVFKHCSIDIEESATSGADPDEHRELEPRVDVLKIDFRLWSHGRCRRSPQSVWRMSRLSEAAKVCLGRVLRRRKEAEEEEEDSGIEDDWGSGQ
ncbi:hypothetical protein PTI98_011769 [Pleurotus ostreatus]|nr:hypothetical protein PTI98_011769 [Pleurotus ostreatus]